MNEERYPPTRWEEIVETVGSMTFRDPYRWLENESEEVRLWQRKQDALAQETIRGMASQTLSLYKLEQHLHPHCVTAPRRVGDRWFWLGVSQYKSQIEVSDRLDSKRRVVQEIPISGVDISENQLTWYEPAPDASLVAVGISEGGGSQSGAQLTRVRVVDVESGSAICDEIPHVVQASCAWLPDASGFDFVCGEGRAEECPERFLCFFNVVDGRKENSEPIRGICWCWPQVSSDGRFVALIQGTREPRTDYIKDRETGSGWQPFLCEVPAACFGVFDEDRYLAITTLDSVKGRIVSIPVNTARDTDTWKEIVPEGEAIIRSISRTEKRLIIGEIVEGCSRVRTCDLDGANLTTLSLAEDGVASTHAQGAWSQTFGQPMVAANRYGCSFVFSSMDRLPAVYVYEESDETIKNVLSHEGAEPNVLICRTRTDGDIENQIPVTLSYSPEHNWSQSSATLIYVYGGYNIASVPAYFGALLPFIHAGGVVAMAHVRGGGECGLEWWRDGHQENRQQCFDDTYAVAEWLVQRGWTTCEQLGIVGLSNGGVIVCVACTQRPDLFRAGVALGPQCDLVRYSRDPFSGGAPIAGHYRGLHVNGGTWRDVSWGRRKKKDRKLAEGPYFPESIYPYPFAYSPYHHVRQGEEYPSLLLFYGDRDVWCPPWHGRKLAARMQKASASGNPILLRVWPGGGHDTPLFGSEECVGEWLGFLMHEVGLQKPGAQEISSPDGEVCDNSKSG